MNQQQMIEIVCRGIYPQRKKDDNCTPSDCILYPRVHKKCRIAEKTDKQLAYVLSSITENIFLKACPGSGKTEVIGLKAAYEFQLWKQKNSGIAILTFTNNAADTIRERVHQFAGIGKAAYPHFIGTIDSWLHGYLAHPFSHLITGYEGEKGDRSIKVVEDGISEGWINNYRCKTNYYFDGKKGELKFIPLFTNKIRFDVENMRWEIKRPRGSEYIKDEDYFNSKAFQKFILDKPWLTLECMRNGFLEAKQKFLQDGYGTYQDIEWICYQLLQKHTNIAQRFSQRFPFIIIDECQDLSWIQLEIFKFLKRYGVSLHIVGDLNQAIYEFKRVDPKKVEEFVSYNKFTQLNLSDNFRSCQPIVNLCQKIVNGDCVVGKESLPHHEPCIYFQYKKDELSTLPNRFEDHLKKLGISIEKSVILARGWSTVYRLYALDKKQADKPQFQMATAIYFWSIWSKGNNELADEALKCLGKFMAKKYFKDKHRNSRQYYCPSIVDSPMRWRFFLSSILGEVLENNCGINNLSKTWVDWAGCVRKQFSQIANNCLSILQSVDSPFEQIDGRSFKAPNGLGRKKVIDTLISSNESSTKIKITTIHKVKGKTFDAVLLVSSPNARGAKGGYWGEWLEDVNEEPARFSYVASSRPKMLLAWAIPDTKGLTEIEKLGFNSVMGK